MVDACFSAAIKPGIEKTTQYLADNERKSIALMVSSNDDVKSYQNSISTEFYEKLKEMFDKCENDAQGYVRISNLKVYTKSKFESRTNKSVIIAHWGSDFTLYRRPLQKK